MSFATIASAFAAVPAVVPRAAAAAAAPSPRFSAFHVVRRPTAATAAVLGATAAPGLALRRQGDSRASQLFIAKRNAAFHLIVRAAAGEGAEEDKSKVEVEIVEDDDDDYNIDGDEEEEEAEEAAAPVVPKSKAAELLAQLQEAVDNANAAEELESVLPELMSEVAALELSLGNALAAQVGLEDQTGAMKDQYLRLNADFDNFKKRTIKEKEQLADAAKAKMLESLLPALDNFELAKANLKTETEAEAKILSSYNGLYNGLLDKLKAAGLIEVEGVGSLFDPNLHQAITREESTEPEDTVIEEFRKGYKIGDRLIRAAMVKVAMPVSEFPAEEAAAAAEETAEEKA